MIRLILFPLFLTTIASHTPLTSFRNYPEISDEALPLYNHRVEDVIRIRPMNDEEYILPKTSRPIDYDVKLSTRIDEGDFSFTGEVLIEIEILEFTSSIVLHSVVNVDEVNLWESDRTTKVELRNYDTDEKLHFLVLNVANENLVPGGRYFVGIKYNAVLRGDNGDYNGFYRSSYVNSAGETKWLASTHFVPFNTRHAFPCYDEPALKATFLITIDHGCGYRAISNMPESFDVIPDLDICRTSFERTPIMPTYLIAFVVSDYEFVANYDGIIQPDRIRHRVFAHDRYINSVTFALENAELMLDYIAEYFDYPFVMPKLDQIAIPQYAVSAMENWGLITYLERVLYTDMESVAERFNSLRVISHELTHKWFGNLVTPSEFGYLWLKEGFATLFGYYHPEILYKDMRFLDNFVLKMCQNVKLSDALPGTRPMSYPVYERDQISAIFDNIAYDKAGCVLHMLMQAMTPDVFNTALNSYLKTREYKEATPEHLSIALNQVTWLLPVGTYPFGLNFADILDSWHTQSGFPVINVTYDPILAIVRFEQYRFSASLSTDPEIGTWIIPYNCIFASEVKNPDAVIKTHAEGWMRFRQLTLNVMPSHNLTNQKWILLNLQQTGYYRVNYNSENWNALIDTLKSEDDYDDLPLLSRSQLIDDAVELALIGQLEFGIALDLLTYLKVEDDPIPWLSAFKKISAFIGIFGDTDMQPKIMHYFRFILEDRYKSIDIYAAPDTGELYNDDVRLNTINYACKSEVAQCLTDTSTALTNHLMGEQVLPQTVFRSIVLHGARNLNKEQFMILWGLLTDADTLTRTNIVAALANVEDEELWLMLLESTLLENNVLLENIIVNFTDSERILIWNSIIEYHIDGWNVIFKHLKESNIQFPSTESNILQILNSLVRNVHSKDRLDKMVTLLDLYSSLQIDVATLKANAENNVAWMDEFGPTINHWLDINNFDGGNSSSQSIHISLALVIFAGVICLLNF